MNEGQVKALFEKLGKSIKFMGKYWLAQCPNPAHPDKNPSCVISTQPPHPFKCKSCGFVGTLDKIAVDFGMEINNLFKPDPNKFRSANLPDLSTLRLEQWSGAYRGVPEEWWRYFKALRWYDTQVKANENNVMEEQLSAVRILLPVYIKGIMMAYVGRRTDTDEFMRYNNYKGADFAQFLYLYDYCHPQCPIVLVEGPLDAIRFHMNGIPAMAIFGVESWSDKKLSLLLEKSPSMIFLCMDGDDPGQDAQRKYYNKLKNFFDTQVITLPKDNDPFDLAPELIESIKVHVWTQHQEKLNPTPVIEEVPCEG
jgi:hypothetical protein